MSNDWRLFREQEKYLYGATLVHQSYKPSSPFNDHDHCEFCMGKFGYGADDFKYGYSTEDNSIWICPQCYKDFSARFGWTLKNRQA